MNPYKNQAKDKFLASIPKTSLDNNDDKLTIKCKFNFAYFTVQPAGQSFEDWTNLQLIKLQDSLKNYCEFSLDHWTKQAVGKSGTVLAIYGKFPDNSDFTIPAHVPHQAQWGRFRLSLAVRLVGFVLPKEYHKKVHPCTNELYDCNTFYVVFLDSEHRFYKGKEVK